MSLEVDVRVHAGGFAVEAAFTAGPGTVALLGPNGAGKSTLVGAIALSLVLVILSICVLVALRERITGTG